MDQPPYFLLFFVQSLHVIISDFLLTFFNSSSFSRRAEIPFVPPLTTSNDGFTLHNKRIAGIWHKLSRRGIYHDYDRRRAPQGKKSQRSEGRVRSIPAVRCGTAH